MVCTSTAQVLSTIFNCVHPEGICVGCANKIRRESGFPEHFVPHLPHPSLGTT